MCVEDNEVSGHIYDFEVQGQDQIYLNDVIYFSLII